MLKRQNVSEKINNVTMYASEKYWNTVGSNMESNLNIDLGLDCYSDAPGYWSGTKLGFGLLGYVIQSVVEDKEYNRYSVRGDQSKYR